MHKKEPVRRRWEIFVRSLQRKFRERTPLEDLAWKIIVLVLKGNGVGVGVL